MITPPCPGLFTRLLAAGILLSLPFFNGCKPEKIEGPDPVDGPKPLKTEDLLGQHTGVCFYHHKNFASMTEVWDTTSNSVLEFKKVDETYTSVSGCGGYDNVNLPETIDSVFFYSGYIGSQSYYWEFEINAIDQTIRTKYKVTAPGGLPGLDEYTGKWSF